jgi:hypothetical protein
VVAPAQTAFETLLLGFETTPGSFPSPRDAVLLPATGAFNPARNQFQSKAPTGRRQPRPSQYGKIGIEGSYHLECSKESVTSPFKALLSAPRSSGTTGFYSHQFGFGSILSTFIEQRHSDIGAGGGYFTINGGYHSHATLNFTAEGLMEADFNVMGIKNSPGLTTEQVTGTVVDKTGEDPFSYLLTRVTIGGVVKGYVESVALNINNNMTRSNAMDQTAYSHAVFADVPTVDGSIVAEFEEKDLFLLADAATETSLEIFLPCGSGHGHYVELPTFKLRPGWPQAQGGVVRSTFQFDGYGKVGASDVAGVVRSMYFTSLSLNGLTLLISPDAGGDQTVTFGASDDTPDEAAAAINTQTTLMTATVDRQAGEIGGVVILKTDKKGSTGSIKIQAASTADTVMGFDNAVHSGLDGQAVVLTVCNASPTVA